MKIAIAGIWHETNTLTIHPTTKSNFINHGWHEGQELIKAFTNTKTVMGGYLETLSKNNIEIISLFGAYATPSGVITKNTFDEILTNLLEKIRNNLGIDGMLLELHGAQVVEGIDDPEALITSKVSELLKDIPLAVVTDFHANMTNERLKHATIWTGYRTNPHIDTFETGIRSAELLINKIKNNLEITMQFSNAGLIYSPIEQSTSDYPFKNLLEKAKSLKDKYNLLDLIVHGGYSFADVAHAGVSFTAVAESDLSDACAKALAEINQYANENKANITQKIMEVSELIEFIKNHSSKKIAIADIADNINGGSSGDSTHILSELMDLNLEVLASICDPNLVEDLQKSRIGDEVEVSIGGWSDPIVGAPVKAKAKIEYLGEGNYTHSGPMYTGQSFTMGKISVLKINKVSLLVQSLPQQPNDLELFRCAGLEPDNFQILLLKGAIALRASWQDRVDYFLNVSSLGTTDCNLQRLPLTKLKGKVWPLI